ncbi:MAG TPA: tRNA (adenosine(37)-N6)-dimethylallyltransferase MiaA [Verrucomicrobiae bacterium]|nr:tRNA (adenosine(37)-N6)-dimethylallyltransferase MiaA [Verrucomicrobiae bacterium]
MTPEPLASDPAPLFLAGPTAVGKSEIALCLAERLKGEIVSVDSMQVYRGLDVGTAKPSAQERRRVPHHLIDVANLNELFDAAQFVRLARAAVADIQSRGRVPIFCGGTGLYFKAFLEGLGEAPPADRRLRAELETTPLSELLRELEQRDPATFGKIDRRNPRRVIRAVEVIRLSSQPFSAQQAAWSSTSSKSGERPNGARIFFGLTRQTADLHARINARVDDMFRNGLVSETERLLQRGLADNRAAMQAIGYRQVAEHLRGERSLAETIELVKIRTRQFAKRQMTWFRRQLDVTWIALEPAEQAASAANRIEAVFQC